MNLALEAPCVPAHEVRGVGQKIRPSGEDDLRQITAVLVVGRASKNRCKITI